MRWIVACFCIAFSGSANSQPASDSAMCSLASPLTRLARAVDAYASENAGARQLQSGDLLRVATQHDPSLLSPFEPYAVSVRVEGRNSSVLVCTADERIGLMEDAGCSARMDAQHWRDSPPLPCGFTLVLETVCSGTARPAANLCR